MIALNLKYLLLLIILNVSSCFAQEEQIITVVNDSKYEGKYYIDTKGLITKFIYYDSLHSSIVTFSYTYAKTGRVERIDFTGSSDVDNFDEEMEKKYLNDAIYQNNFLRQKGISFPLPFINSSELGDMAVIFAVTDKYQTIYKGSEKTIIFDALNKKISFRSLIERYIPHLTVIKQYRITLIKNMLTKEEFVFKGGTLVRSYFYDDTNRLISIVWNCLYDDDPKKYSEIKRFKYNNNGKPVRRTRSKYKTYNPAYKEKLNYPAGGSNKTLFTKELTLSWPMDNLKYYNHYTNTSNARSEYDPRAALYNAEVLSQNDYYSGGFLFCIRPAR
jgi:hypothetical protein